MVATTQPPLPMPTIPSLTPALAACPTPSIISSGLVLVEGSSDLEAPLVEIPRDATFLVWRVIQEPVEMMLLPMELERIEEMGSSTLRRSSVTIVHQVYPRNRLLFLFLFSILFFNIWSLVRLIHFMVALINRSITKERVINHWGEGDRSAKKGQGCHYRGP